MRVSSPFLKVIQFLRLLPHLPLTSIPPFIFPSINRCRRQFLRKMWPIQFAFRLRISCRIFLCSLTLSNTSSFLTWSVQVIFSVCSFSNSSTRSRTKHEKSAIIIQKFIGHETVTNATSSWTGNNVKLVLYFFKTVYSLWVKIVLI